MNLLTLTSSVLYIWFAATAQAIEPFDIPNGMVQAFGAAASCVDIVGGLTASSLAK